MVAKATYTMTHKILCKGRCKPLFANMQTFIRKKFLSDYKNNIAIQSICGNIVLDCCIMTHNGWVARVEFLQDISPKRDKFAKSLAEPKRNDINVPHAELGHPATGTAMGLNLTGMFKQKRVA